MTKGEKIVKTAFAEVGTKESPKNSNLQKYGEWFGYNGVAWCAIFVSWVYAMAGYPLIKMGYLKGFAGVRPALAKYLKGGHVITDREKVRLGALVFFDWNGDGKFDHVEIFNGWVNGATKKSFYSIGGNTSKSNLSNGGAVESNKRKDGPNVIFVHPPELMKDYETA